MDSTNESSRSSPQQDMLASIVVFLVALPLCMGIAIASGVPVSAGLITGIVGGLVTGLLAGCPLQVSGPAAGLTVIVYQSVQQFGVESLGLIVLLTGIMQVLAGVFRLGQWFRAVSPAVVRGMLAGIGVLILASQFHVMFDRQPESSGIKNLLAIPKTVSQSLQHFAFPKSTEERDLQKQTIAEVRKLQRRQQLLKSKATDLLKEGIEGKADFSSLIAEQQTIREELEKLSASFSKVYANESERLEKLSLHTSETLSVLDDTKLALQSQDALKITTALKVASTHVDGVFDRVKNFHLAALVGVLTILSMVFWKAFAPQKLQLVPPALIAVVVGTAFAVTTVLPVVYVDVPQSLVEEIRLPTVSLLQNAPWSSLLSAALLMAVVASAETLLCCTAVDQLQNGPRTKYDQELLAQGIGNSICGLLGALPMTGVIVRSTANIQAGGKTRLSAILHGVWLLVFVVGLSALLRMIPTACLAAILVYTGYKLVDLKTVKNLRTFGWGEVGIYLATLSVIVCKDLLSGVLVGLALAVAKLVYTFSHLETELKPQADGDGSVLDLHGAATFIRLPQFASALERVPRGTNLHINMEHLDYIDHACLDLLMSWTKQHEASGGDVTIDWDFLHAMVRETPRTK